MSETSNHPASLSGEHQDHKVAAICDTRQQAEQVAADICEHTSLSQSQVTVIRPDEPHPGRELEPESRGIWNTMIRSHVRLGIAGAVAGLALFAVLYIAGIPFVALNVMWAAPVFVFIGGLCGLMLGGAFTLRPDHTPYLMKTDSSLRDGKHVVAVHAEDQEQLKEASAQFEKWALKTVRSI